MRKDREISTERKGSNEPIMPVKGLLGTALSSGSLPEVAKQLSAGAGADADDGIGGLQQAFGGGMRQASAQDLEKQHQNMAAAQEQVGAQEGSLQSLCRSLVLQISKTAMASKVLGDRAYATIVSKDDLQGQIQIMASMTTCTECSLHNSLC